ncbi:GntR family transcriptional regulator [Streptomyces sp. TRM43335]|uniref:GntR family transcriptional regulator n=1 Tax=Streptomyces taklimakanensis TaxID=2569853 RepID=A0A6G2BAZ2_9ACTN|nr:GntR family transcriptional regulator [Streptomyces taklimakanensis]MTE19445.1 GntR family transcriptional regulator [Streptomyces taklimakanensis]
MSDKIDPTAPEYAYEQLAGIIERRIKAGTYPPGSKLPGELDIASEFSAGSQTVRRALEILRERGLIVTVRARGSFVKRDVEV